MKRINKMHLWDPETSHKKASPIWKALDPSPDIYKSQVTPWWSRKTLMANLTYPLKSKNMLQTKSTGSSHVQYVNSKYVCFSFLTK